MINDTKTVIQKIYDYVFPIGGGSIGAISKGEMLGYIGDISYMGTLEVALYAAVGAAVGYLVKKLLDKIFGLCKK